MNQSVFINATATFFPNQPVDNQEIEKILGSPHQRPSKSKTLILKSNQIKTRYYAIDPETRKPTHTNSQLTAGAIQNLFSQNPELQLNQVHLLCCGTSTPDLLMPAHGQMVQGHLPEFSGEVVTAAGICCSSMASLKMAYMNILSGEAPSAIATGSEALSKIVRAEHFEAENEKRVDELKKQPIVAFEHDFLRWMLSDGAGAFYLSNQPLAGKVNLKINWIEGRSYANEAPVCMLAGGYREGDGTITSWKDLSVLPDADQKKYVMNISQDIRVLREKIPVYTIEKPLNEIKKKRGLNPGDYKWFLPHYSSDFFREGLYETLGKYDFHIPWDRWFTCLSDKGNTGAASIFIFVHELLQKHQLNSGDKILCYVPESGRFSVYYMELEVV